MQNSLNILLTSNGDIVYQTIEDYLSDSGHDVDRAQDGSSALEAVKDREYDLVLADIRMMSMDDFSLMINMRKVRPDIPVVIITTYGSMKIAIKLLKLGAMDYMLKPVKLLELDAVLEKAIRFRKIIAHRAQDGESPQMDRSDIQRWKLWKRSPLFALMLTACFAVILLMILVPLTFKSRADAGRKYAESALWESERRYHQLSENVTDVVCFMDTDLRFTYINTAITNLLGYAVEEAIGKTWKQLTVPEYHKVIEDLLTKELTSICADKEHFCSLRLVKIQLVRKDGLEECVEMRYAVLQGPEGQSMGLLVTLRGTTKGKEIMDIKS